MRKRADLCLDVFTEGLASVREYDRMQQKLLQGSRSEHQQMLRVLQNAMRRELTQRQSDCVRLYYFEQRKMGEIADILGITLCSVSKHLKKARLRLSRVLEYAFERLERTQEE